MCSYTLETKNGKEFKKSRERPKKCIGGHLDAGLVPIKQVQ